jgi:hypothetical protein
MSYILYSVNQSKFIQFSGLYSRNLSVAPRGRRDKAGTMKPLHRDGYNRYLDRIVNPWIGYVTVDCFRRYHPVLNNLPPVWKNRFLICDFIGATRNPLLGQIKGILCGGWNRGASTYLYNVAARGAAPFPVDTHQKLDLAANSRDGLFKLPSGKHLGSLFYAVRLLEWPRRLFHSNHCAHVTREESSSTTNNWLGKNRRGTFAIIKKKIRNADAVHKRPLYDYGDRRNNTPSP